MEIVELKISGCFEVKNFFASDDRGFFTKTFHSKEFQKSGLETRFEESYYSLSNRNVLRGMHFQIPPKDHNKLVYCVAGKVLDVIVDLRKASPTFKKVVSLELIPGGSSVYIPNGCAHGFLSLEDNSIMVYNVSTVYNKAYDMGVFWKSIDFDWGILNPILSERDENFPSINTLKNPF